MRTNGIESNLIGPCKTSYKVFRLEILSILHNSIENGRYALASEVIRAGLQLVDEQGRKIKLLREALEAGENSGYVKNFDLVKHLADLHKKYGK